MYETILLPVDGSEPAHRATEHALMLADAFDATVHPMYVVDTSRYGSPAISSTELVVDQLESQGSALLDSIADQAERRNIHTESYLCRGKPSAEIIAYADSIDADVTVLGFQGQSHRISNHIGSVAERVVRRANRPVLTV